MVNSLVDPGLPDPPLEVAALAVRERRRYAMLHNQAALSTDTIVSAKVIQKALAIALWATKVWLHIANEMKHLV
jgi:hypothetical protein